MAHPDHVSLLLEGRKAWNRWRIAYPEIRPDLHRADLGGADLRLANFQNVTMHWAQLSGANLLGADFTGADLRAANCSGANLTQARFKRSDLKWIKFVGATLDQTSLAEANLLKADLSGASLRQADLSHVNLRGGNLSRADLSSATLRQTDLQGAVLRDAILHFTDIREANMAHADLTGAEFDQARLIGTRLTGANLSAARLAGACLDDTYLDETKYLSHVKLSDAYHVHHKSKTDPLFDEATPLRLFDCDFEDANLSYSDLSKASLQRANFTRANLEGANLSNCDLTSTSFYEANLSGANLQGCRMCSTILQYAKLDGADLTGSTLWGLQRERWSIKRIRCSWAKLEPSAKTAVTFEDGEFETLYAQQPTIDLLYRGGIRTVELYTLPALLAQLSTLSATRKIRLRSIGDAPGGTRVSIVVEDAEAEEVQTLQAAAEKGQDAQLSFRDSSKRGDRIRIEERIRNMLKEEFSTMMKTVGPKIHIEGSVTGSIIQVTGDSGSNSAHSVTNDLSDISALIARISAEREELGLAGAEGVKLDKALDTLKSELDMKEPKSSVISGSLKIVREIAVKLLESAGEKAVLDLWKPILGHVTTLISQI